MSIWKVCAPVLLSESFGLQVSIEKSDDIFVIYLSLPALRGSPMDGPEPPQCSLCPDDVGPPGPGKSFMPKAWCLSGAPAGKQHRLGGWNTHFGLTAVGAGSPRPGTADSLPGGPLLLTCPHLVSLRPPWCGRAQTVGASSSAPEALVPHSTHPRDLI